MKKDDLRDEWLRLRLAAAVDQFADGSADKFGRLIGYANGGYVREALNSKKPVRGAIIERASDSGVPGLVGWFDGVEAVPAVLPRVSAMPAGAHPIRNQREVPVLGRGQGGLPERVWDDGGYPVGVTDEYAEAATTDQRAFVIRVNGRSMEPRYMEGEYALVEPGTAPEIEDDVLVRLRNDGTMLKRLLGRRGGWRFGSYNETAVLNYRDDEVAWVYYVAHPVPARRIKQRT